MGVVHFLKNGLVVVSPFGSKTRILMLWFFGFGLS